MGYNKNYCVLDLDLFSKYGLGSGKKPLSLTFMQYLLTKVIMQYYWLQPLIVIYDFHKKKYANVHLLRELPLVENLPSTSLNEKITFSIDKTEEKKYFLK